MPGCLGGTWLRIWRAGDALAADGAPAEVPTMNSARGGDRRPSSCDDPVIQKRLAGSPPTTRVRISPALHRASPVDAALAEALRDRSRRSSAPKPPLDLPTATTSIWRGPKLSLRSPSRCHDRAALGVPYVRHGQVGSGPKVAARLDTRRRAASRQETVSDLHGWGSILPVRLATEAGCCGFGRTGCRGRTDV
jgi:hypothetical protein